MLQLVLRDSRRDLGQNFQQITLHQVRFGHTSRDIANVGLSVCKLEPLSEVLQTQERVVSQGIRPIITNTTELQHVLASCESERVQHTAVMRL